MIEKQNDSHLISKDTDDYNEINNEIKLFLVFDIILCLVVYFVD